MSRTKKCARKGKGRGVQIHPRSLTTIRYQKFKQAVAGKPALAHKAAVNRTGGSSSTQTLTLTINPKVSSSDPSSADEMAIWCPESGHDEDDKATSTS